MKSWRAFSATFTDRMSTAENQPITKTVLVSRRRPGLFVNTFSNPFINGAYHSFIAQMRYLIATFTRQSARRSAAQRKLHLSTPGTIAIVPKRCWVGQSPIGTQKKIFFFGHECFVTANIWGFDGWKSVVQIQLRPHLRASGINRPLLRVNASSQRDQPFHHQVWLASARLARVRTLATAGSSCCA